MVDVSGHQSNTEPQSTNDAEPTNFRIQAAMVLFSFEQALGSYIVEVADDTETFPDGIRDDIQARTEKPSLAGHPELGVHGLVQESFLGEIIDAAIASTSQRSDQEYLRRLAALCSALDVFAIRNAVCHPNRPFPECYWHRMAAIATDPAIEALGLRAVMESYRAARAGTLQPVPEDWLAAQSWVIPHNLPSSFDHDITGLIGRQREGEKLLNVLRKNRFPLIAILGPGGSGKTALCLDLLYQIVHDPRATEWTDEIVFVSAKLERLTHTGVKQLDDPIQSLDAVKDALAKALLAHNDISEGLNFSQIADVLAERRILICLDNLETVIRDHPDAFDQFHTDLPANWRVLVTSRINVNAGWVLPLDSIGAGAAKKLARDYLAKRSGDGLSEDNLARIVEGCERNPLAIRLVMDSYVAGAELSDALADTRKNTIEFSYQNLVDALPLHAVRAIECLFCIGGAATRSELGHLLDISVDDIADALNRLRNTTLVTRHSDSDVESFSLSSSVRDLLMRFPKDLETRSLVHRKLVKQREMTRDLDTNPDVNPHDRLAWNYIASDTPKHVQTIAIQAFRVVRLKRSRVTLIAAHDKTSEALRREPADPTLGRADAQLLLKLGDRHGALHALEVASKSSDPASLLMLAKLLKDERRLEESYDRSCTLIAGGWGDPEKSSPGSAADVLRVHWVVAVWLKKDEEALEATRDWESSGELRGTLGCIRISALRCRSERTSVDEVDMGIVRQMVNTIDTLLTKDGYNNTIVWESMKCIKHMASFSRMANIDTAVAQAICGLVDQHLHGMCAVLYEVSIEDNDVRQWVSKLQGLDCGEESNPLRSGNWNEIVNWSEDDVLGKLGFVRAEVYARPKRPDGTPQPFLFAKANDGTEYHVPRRATGLTFSNFDAISVGDTFMLKPQEDAEVGRTCSVREAVLET